MKAFYYILLLLVPFTGNSQSFLRNDSIPVREGGGTQLLPWAGGLNQPQFSDIDLNLDGIKDLFVFDRSGNRILTFLNGGNSDSVDYRLAPEFREKFPPLHDWALLADYNCDGKEDIFTYAISGFSVYRNTSTTTSGLQFSLEKSLVYSQYGTNALNLYVSPVDLPGIEDIDGDGDLDIVTFKISGSTVEYHQNMTKELYGHCDSLKFQLASDCWGNFSEGLGCSNSITQGISCRVSEEYSFDTQSELHAGSCVLCLNTDGDSDYEIALGDISCPNMTLQYNSGDSSSANMTGVIYDFPQATTPVSLNLFPCGYLIDADNDNKLDVLVSPNALNVSENFKGVWFYKNLGTSDSVQLSLIQNDFLQEDMIEVGEGSYPVIVDYDSDGLKDLLIGNYGYYGGSSFQSKIAAYKNTGTVSNPEFELITRDFANIFSSGAGILNLAPTFGDIDNDGDQDMITGDYNGNLHLFEKVPGTAESFLHVANYQSIDVGQMAAPQLVDVNRDGKVDLLIGERSGNLNYYRNNGTVNAPSFALVSDTFGDVNVKKAGFVTGFSTPHLYESSGVYELLVGSENGHLYKYNNIEGNLTGSFTLVDSMFLNIWEGTRTSPFVSDINNDGLEDLFIGNYGGGLTFYKGSNLISVEQLKPINLLINPNPATNFISIPLYFTKGKSTIEVIDLTGRIVSVPYDEQNGNISINISDLTPGIYICIIRNGSKIFTGKIIKQTPH